MKAFLRKAKRKVGRGVIWAGGTACAKALRQKKHHVFKEVKGIVMELMKQ